jgi:predicted nucleotidyltransferase
MMNQTITIMKDRIARILADSSPSIYLFGSVVLDDFKPGWSDIDILCLTRSPITDDQADRLLYLRQELVKEYQNPDFRLFEGGILPLQELMHGTRKAVYWGTRGQRITDQYYLDVFSRMELLDSGRLLFGDEVREHFDYPSRESIFQAVVNHYEAIRTYAVITDNSLYSAGWMLDIARCIHTLRTGRIIAKTRAGKWALEHDLVPDAEVMQRVIRIREQPVLHKNDPEVMNWLETLGEPVQRFADVLEKEIQAASGE